MAEGHHHWRLLARRDDPTYSWLERAERAAVGVALARREDMHPLTLFDLAYDLVHEVVARAAAAEHR